LFEKIENSWLLLTFTGPCIANIFAEYNQQDATFHNLLYFCKTLHVSDGLSVHNQELKTAHTASDRLLLPAASLARLAAGSSKRSDKYLTLYMLFCAPDDGRKNRLKHVERLTEINK